jgi:hypothetical protein
MGCRNDLLFTSPCAAGAAGARLSRIWDRARDLYSRAGLRPYTVTVVRVRYAGMRARGDGPSEIVGEWPLLPTPKVGDLTGLSEVLEADQLRESGSILLSEVSLSYSEDVLLGRGPNGDPVSPAETVFFEIRQLDTAGRVTSRARFVASSKPFADTTRAMWSIMLTRAPWDRDRGGVLR